MQKKLLALAVAGAMAAPLAAQAQGSNVTIYGNLKPSIDMVDNGDESGASVRQNNSLIGFRGSEDLGNGLKAIFQIESEVAFDERGADPTSVLGRRDSWLGLQGGFGSLVIGNMFPAYKRSTDFVDPFADTIGDYNNVFGIEAFDGDGFNDRFRNSVHYISPSWGGFVLQATYGLNSGSPFEDDGDNNSFSLAGTYTWGPLTFAAAYEDQDDRVGEGTKAWKLAVGYKFGSTALAAMYASENFGDFGGGDDRERDLLFLSVKHSIGKIDLAASYLWADEFDDADESGADAWAVGVVYNFSKRTNIGAYYARVGNDDNAFFGFDSGYEPSAAGENVSGFSVRMQHSF